MIFSHHVFPADLYTSTGHFSQLFHPSQGWSFRSDLVEKYGGLVKLRGLFEVCPTHTLPMIEYNVR